MHSLTLIGIFAFLLSLVNATWPPQAALTPLYDVQPGPLEQGGCDVWHSQISELYEEAIHMATKGHEAMLALNYRMGANSPGATDSALKFGYWARGVLAFFGVRVSPMTGPRPIPPGARGGIFENSIVNGVQWVYNAIATGNGNGWGRISCTANGVAFINPTDKDPRVAQEFTDDEKVKNWPELNAKGEYPHGAFWWEHGKSILAIKEGQSTVPKDRICLQTQDGEAAAVTMHDWHAIFICESLFKMPTQTSHDFLKNEMEVGHSLYSYNLENIASKTLLHELTHLWDAQSQDYNAVDPTNPPSLTGPQAPFLPLTSGKQAYGYLQSLLLGANWPEDAPNNADNMANYAFLMYAYDFDNAGYGWNFLSSYSAVKSGTWEKDK